MTASSSFQRAICTSTLAKGLAHTLIPYRIEVAGWYAVYKPVCCDSPEDCRFREESGSCDATAWSSSTFSVPLVCVITSETQTTF